MLCEKIDLYEYFNLDKPQGANGVLTTYVHNVTELNVVRPAMIVFPGGGYTHLSPREAEPVALAYVKQGFNAFVLEYSVDPVRYPYQLIEGCMAIAYARLNAKKHNTDAEHVCVVGFSAGGHLAGCVALMNAYDCVKNALGDYAKLTKPNAVILSYPVIASDKPYSHNGSFEVLSNGDDVVKQSLSLEKLVTLDAPPAFIWHTQEDACVPLENSLQMALSYRRAGVPFEYHVFEKGGHGEALGIPETGYDNPSVAQWVDLSLTWLTRRGFKIKT